MASETSTGNGNISGPHRAVDSSTTNTGPCDPMPASLVDNAGVSFGGSGSFPMQTQRYEDSTSTVGWSSMNVLHNFTHQSQMSNSSLAPGTSSQASSSPGTGNSDTLQNQSRLLRYPPSSRKCNADYNVHLVPFGMPNTANLQTGISDIQSYHHSLPDHQAIDAMIADLFPPGEWREWFHFPGEPSELQGDQAQPQLQMENIAMGHSNVLFDAHKSIVQPRSPVSTQVVAHLQASSQASTSISTSLEPSNADWLVPASVKTSPQLARDPQKRNLVEQCKDRPASYSSSMS